MTLQGNNFPAVAMLDSYSAAMVAHIEFYTVGQYSDWPNDPAEAYSVADCLWQVHKYVARHGKNARAGQDRIDLLKVGHYAAIALGKIEVMNLCDKPDNINSFRVYEWLCTISRLEGYLDMDDAATRAGAVSIIRMYDDYVAHLEQIELILQEINRQSEYPTVSQLLQVVYHAGLAWSRIPAEFDTDLPPVRVKSMAAAVNVNMSVDINQVHLPEFQTDGAAGADIRSAGYTLILPGEKKILHTGIALEIPPGYEGQIRARSGLAAKKQLILLNGVGTIDADYRGEIMVPVQNIGSEAVEVFPGDRIVQLMITPVNRWRFEWAGQLTETVRAACR